MNGRTQSRFNEWRQPLLWITFQFPIPIINDVEMETEQSLYNQGSDEFQEEDVWGVITERKDSDSREKASSQEPFSVSKRLQTAIRMIPKFKQTPIPQENKKPFPHSAPVNVPDWSKIYGNGYIDDDQGLVRSSSWESDDEDDDGDMIPPHEWIARNLARGQVSSFSVFEGAGRTLKGRDLRRVRDDVLTKTGFLETQIKSSE